MISLLFVLFLLVSGSVLVRIAGFKLEEFYLDPRRRGSRLAIALLLQTVAVFLLLVGSGRFIVEVFRVLWSA